MEFWHWEKKKIFASGHICMMPSSLQTLRESSFGCLVRVLAEKCESTSPPCSTYISLRLFSFRALAGDACVMVLLLGECNCSSDPSSSVPSVVLTLYADATGHGTLAWVPESLSKRVFSRGFVPRPLRRWLLGSLSQLCMEYGIS